MVEGLDGATPLDEGETAGLIPNHIVTQDALNAWEQVNIAEAARWLRHRRAGTAVLDQQFLREVHRRMFNATWHWAGKYRTTGKNLGIPASLIAQSLSDLLTDAQYWCEHKTYGPDEIGARFHHRLVKIHPFPNGNGRHARLVTDALLHQLGADPFTWGSATVDTAGSAREAYIAALKVADAGDLRPLMAFVRS